MTDQELKDLFRDRVGDVSYVELYSDENGKVRQMWHLFIKFKSSLEYNSAVIFDFFLFWFWKL